MYKKKLIIALFILSTTLLSCKKSVLETLKDTLVSGQWNIDKYVFTNTSSTFTVNNYGTYTFNKDGNGTYVFSNNPSNVNNFKWSNTDSTITTTLTSNNQTTIFKVVVNDKTKQQWTTSSNNVHYDYTLTKK